MYLILVCTPRNCHLVDLDAQQVLATAKEMDAGTTEAVFLPGEVADWSEFFRETKRGNGVQPAWWAVQVNAIRYEGKGFTVRQLPTFYLDANVQAFMDADGAERVALAVVRAWESENVEYKITVVKL